MKPYRGPLVTIQRYHKFSEEIYDLLKSKKENVKELIKKIFLRISASSIDQILSEAEEKKSLFTDDEIPPESDLTRSKNEKLINIKEDGVEKVKEEEDKNDHLQEVKLDKD